MKTYSTRGDNPVTVWDANTLLENQRPYTVLVSLIDGEVSEPALNTVRALATGSEADLLILNAICYPEQTPFSISDQYQDEHRKAVRDVTETVSQANPSLSVSGTAHLGRTLVTTVADAVEDHNIGAIVVDQSWCSSRLSPLIRSPIERLSGRVDCPVVAASSATQQAPVESILLAVTADSDSNGATKIASAIASASDARIDRCRLWSLTRASIDRDLSMKDCEREMSCLEADDPVDALIEKSQEYDMTILEAPQRGRLQRLLCGSMPTDVRASANSAIVTVWGESRGSTLRAKGMEADR